MGVETRERTTHGRRFLLCVQFGKETIESLLRLSIE